MAKKKETEQETQAPRTKMDVLIKKMNTEAKESSGNKDEEVISLGMTRYNYTRIPFTSPRMNYCTFGGIPVGKIIEFYGEEGGGKTTTALDIVANYQHMENAKKVLYIDAENTLDLEWAEKLGVNVDDIYVYQPKSDGAEKIFDYICEAVKTDEIGLWVLDSIGMLMSDDEWEKDMDEATYAGISKPLTRFSKKIEMLCARHNCTGIGINQLRDDLKSMWGGTKTPGGRGWKHACIMRLQFSKGKYIDEKGNEVSKSLENPFGNTVIMSITKTKACSPSRRVGTYTIDYAIGIDYLKDLVDVAILYGIIEKSGSWFEIIDTTTGDIIADKIQGQANLTSYLEDNIEVLKKVEELVDLKMNEK